MLTGLSNTAGAAGCSCTDGIEGPSPHSAIWMPAWSRELPGHDDAHLAALATEHQATLCSTDADFARFPGLKWESPLAG